MYGLPKKSTINYLKSASQSQHQMYYHRNHRNLLFLCHPFRAHHSMKTNNNTKCCLLLDNLANKKCIKIQSRGLRHRASGRSKTEKSADTSSTDTSVSDADDGNGTEQIMDPRKLLSKFQLNVTEFIEKFRKDAVRKQMNPMTASFKLYEEIDKFIEKFNKENAKTGYKIEHPIMLFLEKFHPGIERGGKIEAISHCTSGTEADFQFRPGRSAEQIFRDRNFDPITKEEYFIIIIFIIISFPISLYINWRIQQRVQNYLFPGQKSRPPHENIVKVKEKPVKITYDQFLQDYLPSGQIAHYFHYQDQEQNLLLILLHEGSIINGKLFTAPGSHVQLPESFRNMSEREIMQRIQEEERRIYLQKRDSKNQKEENVRGLKNIIPIPDVSKEKGANEKSQEINEAYEVLSDSKRRKEYDHSRAPKATTSDTDQTEFGKRQNRPGSRPAEQNFRQSEYDFYANQEKAVIFGKIVFFIGIIVIVHLFWQFNKSRQRENVVKEKEKPVEITYDQFLKDYLPSVVREIDHIFHYPERKLLAVLIRKGAVINGKPFTAPGLHVQLPESFNDMPPWEIMQRIQNEARRSGLRKRDSQNQKEAMSSELYQN